MITYTKSIMDGRIAHYKAEGTGNIPHYPGNRHYDQMMQEVADGLAEIVEQDDTPVETFEDRMAASDAILPRYVEDLVDALEALGGTIPAELATKVADKKQLRSNG